MRVSVLYFADCPNWRQAGDHLRSALDRIGQPATDIEFVAVRSDAEAAALRFAGSPTFMVDGTDLFAAETDVASMTCRVYATASGALVGVPDVDDLVAALREKVDA